MNRPIVHSIEGEVVGQKLHAVTVRVWDEACKEWVVAYQKLSPEPFSVVVEGDLRKDEVL